MSILKHLKTATVLVNVDTEYKPRYYLQNKNTFKYKDYLKDLKFQWDNTKKQWYCYEAKQAQQVDKLISTNQPVPSLISRNLTADDITLTHKQARLALSLIKKQGLKAFKRTSLGSKYHGKLPTEQELEKLHEYSNHELLNFLLSKVTPFDFSQFLTQIKKVSK